MGSILLQHDGIIEKTERKDHILTPCQTDRLNLKKYDQWVL